MNDKYSNMPESKRQMIMERKKTREEKKDKPKHVKYNAKYWRKKWNKKHSPYKTKEEYNAHMREWRRKQKEKHIEG